MCHSRQSVFRVLGIYNFVLCERKTGTLFNSNIRSDVCCLCFTKKMNFYTFVDCKYVVGKQCKNSFGASSFVEKIINTQHIQKLLHLYLVIILIMPKIITSKNCNRYFVLEGTPIYCCRLEQFQKTITQFQSNLFLLFCPKEGKHSQINNYHTRAIISRGLYTFLPQFQRPFMYCDLWPYVWLVFKSGF